jgi:hypothetical protein
MSAGTTLSSDTVKLGNGALVFSISANHLVGHNAQMVPVTPLPLPLVPEFCQLPAFTCSPGNDVTVQRDQATVLTPGSYGQVRVSNGASLTLLPGEYHFCLLKTGRASEVIVQGPGQSIIDVAGNVTIGGNGELRTDDGTVSPVLNVGSGSTSVSIRFGPSSVINAFITAPKALLRLGRSAALHGSFCVDVIGSDNRALLACP